MTQPDPNSPTAPVASDPTAVPPPVVDPAPAPPQPSPTTPAPVATPPVDVGAVVTFAHDPEDDQSATSRALVVGHVSRSTDDKGNVLREEGLYVVPLPDPQFIQLTAVRD